MPIADYAISILFLLFLTVFVLIGTSKPLHRWLDRLLGPGGAEGESPVERDTGEEAGEIHGGMTRQAGDYEAIVFQQLALAVDKGKSAGSLADELHFDRKVIEKALVSLHARGMVRRGGLLGRTFHLSGKGRERAVQEGMIPRIRSGPGG